MRSHRGTQFRQWATARLSEYLVKGFTMDDERLKNPPGKGQTDYFDELLERIRDIRSSERRFYQKMLDIYATSVDYTPEHASCRNSSSRRCRTRCTGRRTATRRRRSSMQRADARKPFMGLQTTRPGGIIRKEDVVIAKNYLDERGARRAEPDRERLHRVRRAAGAATQADDDARLMGLSHDEHFRQTYLLPALQSGLIEMTIPDKPTSRCRNTGLQRPRE